MFSKYWNVGEKGLEFGDRVYNKQMKGFSIAQLVIYDPKRPSPKRKPIEIQIQQAKILVYWPQEMPIEQKCNTVGMAEGVFNFCHSLIKPTTEDVRGWQTIVMEECVLILSQVEEDLWIFIRLQYDAQNHYGRNLDPDCENGYLDNNFSQEVCHSFMENLYNSFRMWYGPIRGWIFRQRIAELQEIITAFVSRFQEIFAYEGRLDILSLIMRDVRLIPLDINSTLKFLYFKNVVQSYDANIAHIAIFSNGLLAYSSLAKDDNEYFANYLYANGQPYVFSNLAPRLNLLPEIPKGYRPHKFGYYYNSRVLGLEEGKQWDRSSVSVASKPSSDLLGLESNRYQLFEVHLKGQQGPMRVNFYLQGSLLFLTFLRQNPQPSQMLFQNRFYHDNADKFLAKINESLIGVLKPNDPYRFLFHNVATYSGKSTIRQWKNLGRQVREALEVLLAGKQALVLSLGQGYWIYGLHRFCRVLVVLVPSDTPLQRVDEYVTKMTKEYFTKAYI